MGMATRSAHELRLLADPTRARIMSLIRDSPQERQLVGVLAVQLGLRQPTVSHHVKALLDAGLYVRIVEERQGLKICCPEEIAYRMGFIDANALRVLAAPLMKSGYGEYLVNLLREEFAD